MIQLTHKNSTTTTTNFTYPSHNFYFYLRTLYVNFLNSLLFFKKSFQTSLHHISYFLSVRQYLFSVDDVQSPESDCVYQQDVYINLEKHKELCLSGKLIETSK